MNIFKENQLSSLIKFFFVIWLKTVLYMNYNCDGNVNVNCWCNLVNKRIVVNRIFIAKNRETFFTTIFLHPSLFLTRLCECFIVCK